MTGQRLIIQLAAAQTAELIGRLGGGRGGGERGAVVKLNGTLHLKGGDMQMRPFVFKVEICK